MEQESSLIKVLIVEDHVLVAEGLEARISSEPGMEVVGRAGTVRAGVDMALQKVPDVILMDYQLPDGTGSEATRVIKQQRPETMVVIVTGYADDHALVEAIEAGCSGFITKDKASREVVDAIRAANAGEALVTPAMLGRLLPKLVKGTEKRKGPGSELTKRELQILQLLSEGLSNRQIADQLVLSLHTVRNLVQKVISKTQTHSKLEAVAKGIRDGLISYSSTR